MVGRWLQRYPPTVTSIPELASPNRWSAVAATIAVAQGLALIGNGLLVAFVVLRDGITGPAAVASPAGIVTEVVIFLLFGAALLWIARGLWLGQEGVRSPFLLAQILSLTVGIPLATNDGLTMLVGILITAIAVVGIGSWWLVLQRSNQ